MRFVTIKFSKRSAFPGELIRGVVVVKTDDPFDCNRIIMRVSGKETIEVGSGDSSVKDEKTHVRGSLVLSEALMIPEGESEFPFQFRLSEELPPTYSGYHGYIEYNVEAVVEISWKPDLKIKRVFKVLPFSPPFIPKPDGYSPKRKSYSSMHIELNEAVLRIREGINVQFMIEERSRVNGIRFEIRRREDVRCSGWDYDHTTTVARKFVPLPEIDFGGWWEVTVGEGWRRVPFQSRMIKTRYRLRVTLELTLDVDPWLEFPLQVSGERTADDYDDDSDVVFEPIISDWDFS